MRALVRIVLSIFVAALIVQTTAISKSFADCPPNCRKGNQSAPPASPPALEPAPQMRALLSAIRRAGAGAAFRI